MNYVEIYLKHFDYDKSDVILCEVCNAVSVDIHHAIPRSKIFGAARDDIKNLVALCRTCHDKEHNGIKNPQLKAIHLQNLINHKKPF